MSQTLLSEGFYVPQGELAFSSRNRLPQKALILRASDFDAHFADDGSPQDSKNLNRDCFFNPYATSERCKPKSNVGVTYAVMGRYSLQTYAAQFALCEIEATSKAGLLGFLAGLGEIRLSWRLGQRSSLCPVAQKGFEFYADSTAAFIKARIALAEGRYLQSKF